MASDLQRKNATWKTSTLDHFQTRKPEELWPDWLPVVFQSTINTNERSVVKERARGDNKEKEAWGDSLSLSFSSFPSPLALSLVTLFVFPAPRAIQIEKTGDESGAVAVTFEGDFKGVDPDNGNYQSLNWFVRYLFRVKNFCHTRRKFYGANEDWCWNFFRAPPKFHKGIFLRVRNLSLNILTNL